MRVLEVFLNNLFQGGDSIENLRLYLVFASESRSFLQGRRAEAWHPKTEKGWGLSFLLSLGFTVHDRG